MSHSRSAPALVVCFVALSLGQTQTQVVPELDKKKDDAIQRTQRLLDEGLIEAKDFQDELPLAKFLAALERRLPKDKKIVLRIDEKAFGPKFAEVAATPMKLPETPKKRTLRGILATVIATVKTESDYLPGAAEVVLTTPERARYAAAYDIRDLVAKPEAINMLGPGRDVFKENLRLRHAEPAQTAALVVQSIVAHLAQLGAPNTTDHVVIQVVNGVRLLVKTNAAGHAAIAELLQAGRRAGDLAAIVKGTLYEVDEATHKKIANLKRHSMDELEEMEKQFLEGKLPQVEPLLNKNHKVLLNGEAVHIENRRQAAFLSWHRAIGCLPGPDQVGQGEKARQTVLEGVSFLAGVEVSPDRRYVWLKLTEKTAVLKVVHKVKAWDLSGKEPKQVVAEVPILDESIQSSKLLIPDGGAILVPVHFRPRGGDGKERWWVLSITPRIIIEEEEQRIQRGALEDILPLVLADILKNPRLKTTREFYGSPDDKRFALVDSGVWTWPKEFEPKVAGHELTPAQPKGKRLLGFRVDKYDGSEFVVVTLVNAGGSANGAVLGGCTIRYRARHGEKGWAVELAEGKEE